MVRFCTSWMAVASVALSAAASVTLSVDLVDPSDGITQPPPGLIAIDVLVDVTPDDVWTAGGTRVVVTSIGEMDGVQLVYAPIADPNQPALRLLNPGVDDRFVTFLSRPRGRDDDERYTSSGAGLSTTYTSGPYPHTYPEELNVAWFRSPPATVGSPSVDGAIARVVIDVSTLQVRQPDAQFVVGDPDDATGPVILASVAGGAPGTASITFRTPTLTGLDWAVWYIPEPASIVLILVGAIVLRRR